MSPFNLDEWLETTAVKEPEVFDLDKWLEDTALEKKPTWWGAGWEKIKIGYDWLTSPEREAELQEIVRETQEGKPLGPVYTRMVRLLPGAEDLRDWEEQPLWEKAWTVARFASAVAVGIITTESLAVAAGGTKAYLEARYPRVRTYREYKWVIDKKTGLLVTKKVPKAPPIEKPYPKRFVKPEAKPTPEITLKPSADAAVKKFVRSVPVVEEQVQLSAAKIEAQNMFDKYIRMIDPSVSIKASLGASTKITQEVTKYLPKVFDPRILETIGREGMKLAALAPDRIKMEVPIISEEPKIPEEKIVEEEIVRPLTPTPEEYAAPEVVPREDLTLAMRDTKTGEIITATPDEKIHTDMMARLQERYKDMEPGWVDSKGKFYDVLSGRRTLVGFEPTEEAEEIYRKEVLAKITEEPTIIQRIKEKGGIKYTEEIRDYGSFKDIPLGAKNKAGLAFDEMADELGITTDSLWEQLTAVRPGIEEVAVPIGEPEILLRVPGASVIEPKESVTTPVGQVIEPIKRSEIVKNISDKLGVPIKFGHFRARALGIYKKKEEIIRLKVPIDVPTASHEIGHYLDEIVFKFDKSTYADELMPLDAKGKLKEGYAEFVRLYVIDREKARGIAPGFFSHFEEQISTIPEVKEILDTTSRDYQRWLTMPSAAKVASQIAYEPQKSGTASIGRLYTMLVDELYPLKRYTDVVRKKGFEVAAEEDPFILATLHRGWHGKADAFLQHRTFDTNFDWNGEPLQAILKPITDKQNLKDFDGYLVAKQSIFRSEQKKKTGIDIEVAKQAVKELEEKNPEFKDLSKRLYDYEDRLLRYARDAGLISQETYGKFRKNLTYVPLHRVMETMRQKGLLGKGYVDLPKVFKPFKGSERDIVPPTESIVKNTYLLIDAAERNRIAQSVVKLAEQHPELAKHVEKIPGDIAKVVNLSEQEMKKVLKSQGLEDMDVDINEVINIFRPSMFKPRGNVITVVQDGKRAYYEVDPDIYRSLTMTDRESQNLLVQLLSYPARMLRLGAVSLSPEFVVRNPLRDAFTAFVHSKAGFIPGLDTTRGLFSAITHDELYWKWKISGAEHSMLTSLDREYLQKGIKELMATSVGKVKNVIKHPLRSAQMFAEFGEEATRIAEYNLVEKGGKRWWMVAERIPEEATERERMLRAGYAAREVTLDFARLGTKTRAVNQIIAFWNANVQDIDKIRRSFQEHPNRTLYKILMGVTIPSVLLWLANKDNERYKELPQWQKDLFWIVITEKRMWRIPKPFTIGLIFGSGVERTLEYISENDPEAIKQLGRNIYQGVTPGFLPTAFLAPIEAATNYSFFLDRPIVSESRQNLPPELQYTPYTTDTAGRLGEALGVSPQKVEYFIRGHTGGFGKLAMETADEMTRTVLRKDRDLPARTLADVPMLRGFVAREPWGQSESINRFYNKYEQAEKGMAAIRQLAKEGRREEAEEYKLKYPEFKYIAELRKVAQALSQLRQRKLSIQISSFTPEDKLRRITEIEKQMTRLARTILERMERTK